MSGAARRPLTALVVDDELPALSEVAYLLERDPRIGEVVTASSGTEALRALEGRAVDVVFSDISMPGLDGMALARVVARFAERPQVVFVTAHDHHAVDAFAVRAVDYVMKPVREDRLAEAVRRAVDAVFPAGAATEPDETVAVELGGVTRFVARGSIRYVEAQGDYARLYTDTGSHLVRTPLATLEERWSGAGFLRIHRSTLVNLAHVTEVRMSHGRYAVALGDTELPVSRRHAKDLRDTLLGPRRDERG
jgi:DNA-binding LytR/AlgR family response regulator